MDKTRGFQASIDYLMPIVEHPSMSGEYCRHLRNGIDAMMKFEQIQSELERLNAENALLRKVADAAKELVTQINNRTKTMGLDMSNYHAISITVKPGDAGRDYWEAVWAFEQALAELDKEGDE